MRTWMAGLLLVALLAGCSGKPAPTTTAPPPMAQASTAPGFQGLHANDTVSVLPAAFGGGFRVVSAATGFHGGEPNVGVTSGGTVWTTAQVPSAVAGGVPVGYGAAIRSTDGGKTWTESADPTHDPLTLDPMLWVDRQTDRVFSNHLNAACSWLSYSDDDGATWTPSPAACGLPAADHQKLASGPYAAGSPFAALASPLYPNLVTFCYNKIGGTFCAVSFDGGLHFVLDTLVDAAPVSSAVATDRSCGGINGHQKFGADGTLYLPYGLRCGQAFVATSTDSGATWTPHRLGAPQLEIDPAVTVTPDGTAYYMGRGDDQAMYLYRSHDRFATHEGPFRITPPDVNGTVFAGLTSGSDGRIAFAYLGHKGDLAHPALPHSTDKGGSHTRWHLYVGMSLDAEAPDPFFLIHQATPDDDPVQVGCVQITGEGTDPDDPFSLPRCDQRNLFDFIDMATDRDGRFWVSYTDGCTSKSCALPDALPVDSRDSLVTVARMEEGPSLYADKGRLGPT
jgi:hypothetical protein